MKIHFNYIKCGFDVNRLGRKLGSFKMEIKKTDWVGKEVGVEVNTQ